MYKFPDGFYADVRIEKVFRSLVRIETGRLEEVKEKEDHGAFIRLFDGSRWFYASTTDLASIDLELAELAKLGQANGTIAEHPAVMRMQVNKGEYCRFSASSVKDKPLQEKIRLTESFASLVAEDKQISHWSAIYSDSRVIKHFSSSLGADLTFDTQTAGLRLGFRFGSGANVFSESWCKARSDFNELHELHQEARDFIEQARDFFVRAEKIPGGNYTVVLSPMAAGIFAHESFGHKSEADFMIGDETMKREWQIGRRVGSDQLSIVDDGNIAGSGFTPFDDEGTRAERTVLIDHGILRGRLHSSATAAELGEAVTGNARSINFEYEPIVRMTATYIEPGNCSKEELITGISHGILIDSVKHGSGMSTFTLAPSMAYLIENGKVTRPVKFSVITGNVMKTLDQIDGVSRELEILSFVGGGCGKMEQYPLPVSFGGPYVRVREINVQ
ncbi:MAG TPA: TldD/PmbA family protein [Candidatus Rifleibacterium sp.]|nr:TldD/PmbA family protein [Candidatus Rifleibacterium sp.]HPT47082.1 TldD/PmbA family protein [Candidatus Rifleibacterium sp.]